MGGCEDLESGVYYGWAGVAVDGEGRQESVKGEGGGAGRVWEMVMSVGWNPFYKNSARSVVGFSSSFFVFLSLYVYMGMDFDALTVCWWEPGSPYSAPFS